MKTWLSLGLSVGMVASGCAAGPTGSLFTSVKGPRHFDPGESINPAASVISGESCSMSILGLIALGDWSVDAALRAAGAEGKTLKNVAVDSRTMTILGALYGNYCTQITAQVVDGAMPVAEAPALEVVPVAPVAVGRQLSTGQVVKGNDGGIEYSLLDFVQDPNRPVDKTTWFNFDRVVFKSGSAEIDMEASKEQLANIHEILKAYPAVKLKVGGYTDNTGSAATNKKLSGQRATAVVGALQKLGTDASRLDPEGYGPEHPVCPANDTPECRAQNRRLAVRVTAK